MKKLILFILSSITCFAANEFDSLVKALIQVESGGDASAIGDNGKAYGVLQIHDIMIQDFNRIQKIKGNKLFLKHSDAFNPEISVFVCKTVLSFYGKWIVNTKGYVTLEDLARIWNGGASAWKDQSEKNPQKELNLKNYWQKVKKNI